MIVTMTSEVFQFSFEGEKVPVGPGFDIKTLYEKLDQKLDTAWEQPIFERNAVSGRRIVIFSDENDDNKLGYEKRIFLCGITPKEYLSNTQVCLVKREQLNSETYEAFFINLKKGMWQSSDIIPWFKYNHGCQEDWVGSLMDLMNTDDENARKLCNVRKLPPRKRVEVISKILG